MSAPRLLDLFCGAGGAAMGYHRAGFDIVGVDIRPQPNYPFEFHQWDAMTALRWRDLMWLEAGRPFDAIHASPPCQGYLNLGAVNRALGRINTHERLIADVRARLIVVGLPYIIENVADASSEMIDPVRVCGTGLGLPLRRHRLFESNLPLTGVSCAHQRFTEKRYWTSWRPNGEHRFATTVQVYGNAGGREQWPTAMGIDWMTNSELVEAIPPAYCEYIGGQLLEHVTAAAV